MPRKSLLNKDRTIIQPNDTCPWNGAFFMPKTTDLGGDAKCTIWWKNGIAWTNGWTNGWTKTCKIYSLNICLMTYKRLKSVKYAFKVPLNAV